MLESGLGSAHLAPATWDGLVVALQQLLELSCLELGLQLVPDLPQQLVLFLQGTGTAVRGKWDGLTWCTSHLQGLLLRKLLLCLLDGRRWGLRLPFLASMEQVTIK